MPTAVSSGPRNIEAGSSSGTDVGPSPGTEAGSNPVSASTEDYIVVDSYELEWRKAWVHTPDAII